MAGAAALLALSGPAAAQITTLEESGPITDDYVEPYPLFVVGLTAFGGFGSVAMDDLNEALVVVNGQILAQGTAVKFDDFTGFLAYGGGIRSIVKGRILLEAIYERQTQDQSVGGITAENIIEIPVDSFLFTLGYDFLGSRRDTRFGFGLGVGHYDSKVKQTLTETPQSEDTYTLGTVDIEGTGWGSHYIMFFEKNITEKFFISAQFGYRSAKVSDIELKGLGDISDPRSEQAFVSVPIGVCTDADGNVVACDGSEGEPVGTRLKGGGTELDWSGFEGRVGFTYYFNIPSPW
jgi:hypothetical protein